MTQKIVSTLHEQMEKSLGAFKDELTKLRTGRATPALVEKVMVDYYGTPTPIQQVANINAPDAKTIVIQPWDHSALSEIEKALIKSDLGITPQNDGSVVRLNMPPMTEERRKDVVKQAGQLAEEARISVRNIRRGGIDQLKKLQKDKEITEDDLKKGQDQIQKQTDDFIKKVDIALEQKSKDIMSV